MACFPVVTDCQHLSAKRLRGFDWSAECAKVRASGEVYEAGECVRPAVATGFELKCTVAGQTADAEPDYRLATAEGETLQDGSVTWTLQKTSEESLRKTITNSAWAVDPSGLTLSGADTLSTGGEEKTSVYTSGGTADETYRVTNTVTFSDGSIGVAAYDVTVEE